MLEDIDEGTVVVGGADNLCADTVDGGNMMGCQSLGGRTGSDLRTVGKEQHLIRIAEGQVEVVENGEDPHATVAREALEESEDGMLVAEVESTCRLVQKQPGPSGITGGLRSSSLPFKLGKHTGKVDPLLFATTEARVVPVLEGTHFHRLEGFGAGPEVLWRFPSTEMRDPPEHDHLGDAEVKTETAALAQDGATPGDLRWIQSGEGNILVKDLTMVRQEFPCEDL